MAYTYAHARPAITVDCVIFGSKTDCLKVLLIQRASEPFIGKWALPGGFVNVGESLQDAAQRELREETGLSQVSLEQLHAFGDPTRDPREHIITVAFYGRIDIDTQPIQASSDAKDAAWFDVNHLPVLAFDHHAIVDMALVRQAVI